MKRQNVRSLLLVVVMMVYLLIGAAVFEALESSHEEHAREKLEREKMELMKKYNLTLSDWELLSDHVVRYIPHKAGVQWKFAGAIYFSTTVITTIGYGHCTPKTNWGKIFCMFYALIGIPINLVTFQSIGERLNTFTTFLLCTVRRKFRPTTEQGSPSPDTFHKTTQQSCSKPVYNYESYNNDLTRNLNFSSFSKCCQRNFHQTKLCENSTQDSYQTGLSKTKWHHQELFNNRINSRSSDNHDSSPDIDTHAVNRNDPMTNKDFFIKRNIEITHTPLKKDFLSGIIGKDRQEWSLNDLLSASFTTRVGEVSDTHLICVTTSISSIFVAGGAYAFSRYEGWSYLDSLYFCIITLTTVGFGDLVALQKDKVLQDKPGYVTFNIFFILSGLAVVSAAMNLLVLRFLTMNTEDEKRDKMIESFNMEPKSLMNFVPHLSTFHAQDENYKVTKKFISLTDLMYKLRKNLFKASPVSPLLRPSRYRVTRGPIRDVHHLIDVSPMPISQSFVKKTKYPIIPSAKCTCKSQLLTM